MIERCDHLRQRDSLACTSDVEVLDQLASTSTMPLPAATAVYCDDAVPPGDLLRRWCEDGTRGGNRLWAIAFGVSAGARSSAWSATGSRDRRSRPSTGPCPSPRRPRASRAHAARPGAFGDQLQDGERPDDRSVAGRSAGLRHRCAGCAGGHNRQSRRRDRPPGSPAGHQRACGDAAIRAPPPAAQAGRRAGSQRSPEMPHPGQA